MYREAADRGDTSALHELARCWEQAGHADRARRLTLFGLDDAGHPAGSLD
jgi:hypothetical protein